MSIFKRIGNLLKPERIPPSEQPFNPFENTSVGDIITVDLEEYIVSGKVIYSDRGYPPHRFAYYLQNGRTIICLIVEKGRIYDCCLCTFLEGALDNPSDVPTELVLDGRTTYNLEYTRNDFTRTEGNTDFRSGDDVTLWRYLGGNNQFFYLQWQDGKFVAMEGKRVSESEISFMRASK
ncbi:DUF4178 domain-containing protein [Paenibacillus turpanensis]|uniref:DUF4178 domain-containing protein n=1 Tax=Paenibacillus turpanensis TaxID=2689078 RepID=UPI00140804AB|nr:DUF4178 domain-containing protein [Paenibacillus turpanensis]